MDCFVSLESSIRLSWRSRFGSFSNGALFPSKALNAFGIKFGHLPVCIPCSALNCFRKARSPTVRTDLNFVLTNLHSDWYIGKIRSKHGAII
jgi:hypothetical protein